LGQLNAARGGTFPLAEHSASCIVAPERRMNAVPMRQRSLFVKRLAKTIDPETVVSSHVLRPTNWPVNDSRKTFHYKKTSKWFVDVGVCSANRGCWFAWRNWGLTTVDYGCQR